MSEEKENPDPIINIVGEKVTLGPLRQDLLPLYTRWMNDFEAVRMLGITLAPLPDETEKEWYDKTRNSDDGVNFTIYVRETMQPIGTTGLKSISYRNQRCEFGIMIGEKSTWNKGYGTETARLLLDYGFNVLGLHSISLTVFSSNPRGIRAYEKAGYKVVGRLRESIRLGQEFYDVIYMDCLASEFPKPERLTTDRRDAASIGRPNL